MTAQRHICTIKFEDPESDAKREMEQEMPYSWGVISVYEEAEYVYGISAWVENIHGSTDAEYGFIEKYLSGPVEGSELKFETAEIAIDYAVKGMLECGYTRMNKRIEWSCDPMNDCGSVHDRWLLQTQRIESKVAQIEAEERQRKTIGDYINCHVPNYAKRHFCEINDDHMTWDLDTEVGESTKQAIEATRQYVHLFLDDNEVMVDEINAAWKACAKQIAIYAYG